MYLNNLLPLPVNSNPGWVFPRQQFDGLDDMVKYMTKLIVGLTQFKQRLERYQKLTFLKDILHNSSFMGNNSFIYLPIIYIC